MNERDRTRVRKASISDLSDIRDLIRRTIDVSYATAYPPRAVRFFQQFHSEERIHQRFRDGVILVAENDGEAIGTGSLAGIEILGVFILPEYQKQGVGRMLMHALEESAAEAGIHQVELSISLPSRKFYENLGYEVVSGHSFDVGEGQELAYWQGRKRLK